MRATKRAAKTRPIYFLLLVPFFVLLSVGFYNRATPELFGIPFFYWFQLACIPFGALLIWPVFAAENRTARREFEHQPSNNPE